MRLATAEIFRLEIRADPEGGYLVEAEAAGATRQGALSLPPLDQLDRMLSSVAVAMLARRDFTVLDGARADGASAGAAEEAVRELGEALYRALFPPPVAELFAQLRGTTGERPLRLVIAHDLPTPDMPPLLDSLPWEALRDPTTGSYLACGRDRSLVRFLRLPGTVYPAPEVKRLRVLAVASDVGDVGYPALDLEREMAGLERLAGGTSRLHVHPLRNPPWATVLDELERGGYHALHFMGHGRLESPADSVAGADDALAGVRGALAFRDAGGVRWIDGDELAEAICQCARLRLVFLNACRTAAAARELPLAGVATALLRRGVPAVVAMQQPVRDEAAIALSAKVYRRLAAGDGLEAAVSSGRRTLFANGGPDWIVPVLFSRVEELRLFRRGAGMVRPVVAVGGLAAALLVTIALGIAGWSARLGRLGADHGPAGAGPSAASTGRVSPPPPDAITGRQESADDGSPGTGKSGVGGPAAAGDEATIDSRSEAADRGNAATASDAESPRPAATGETRRGLADPADPRPARDAEADTPSTRAALHHLRDGDVLEIPAAGAVVAVELHPQMGLATLTVTADGARARPLAFVGPDSRVLDVPGGRLHIDVVAVQLGQGSLDVRLWREVP